MQIKKLLNLFLKVLASEQQQQLIMNKNGRKTPKQCINNATKKRKREILIKNGIKSEKPHKKQRLINTYSGAQKSTLKSKNQFYASVEGLQFGVFGPNEIRALSVVHVNTPQQFENGRPIENGIFDLRMGATTRALRCATCGRDKDNCPGHFGHIDLHVPVVHPFYLDTVKKVLTCVCLHCSQLLVTKDEKFLTAMKKKANPKQRLMAVYNSLCSKKVRVCEACLSKKSPAKKESHETNEVASNKEKTVEIQVKRGSMQQQYERQSLLKRQKKTFGVAAAVQPEKMVQGSGSMFHQCKDTFQMPIELDNSRRCFTVQPQIVHEMTNFYCVWPEAGDVHSHLQRKIDNSPKDLSANTNEQNLEEPQKHDGAQPVAAKKKGRRKKKDTTHAHVEKLIQKSKYKWPTRKKCGDREPLSSSKILQILNQISDEDAYLLGFDPLYGHPAWFVLTALPVLPPCARPLASNSKSASKKAGTHVILDDISFKLTDLIKKNNDLAKQRSHQDINMSKLQELVKHHVMTLICNNIRGQAKSQRTPNGLQLESLTADWKGKHGAVRGVMLGKRVNFTSRAVIDCTPNIRSDQLGVPAKVARTLTVREHVNPLNIERLQECVDNGPFAHRNGANYVHTKNGLQIDLQFRRHVHLEIGYQVDRHLIDNDIVVFNRQPSLHRMSMMAFRTLIHDNDVYKFALSVTTPFNGDFDGDEMNLHAVQSAVARVECAQLMSVASQIVTPQLNAPVIGVVQDTLLAARLFTQRDNFLTHAEVCQIVMWLEHCDDCALTKSTYRTRHPKNGKFVLPVPCILRPQKLWSGKQIFSMFLPPDLQYERRSRAFSEFKKRMSGFLAANRSDAQYWDPCDTMTIVHDGQLLCGLIDKKSIGHSGRSFVHIVHNDLGGQRCLDMIDCIVRCMRQYLLQRGFSVGISDMMLDKQSEKHIAQLKQQTYDTVDAINAAYINNELEKAPGLTLEETFEMKINETLNNCRDKIGNFVHNTMPLGNQLKAMLTAGSKGKLTNLAQMVGGLGQNNVAGKRMPKSYFGRSTPHALPDDPSDIGGRGFVPNSFMTGLDPLQQFTHAMGGREGLVGTAVKTSETGYIQRRFVNFLGDLTLSYQGGTVRNSAQQIVQFAYGEDGMDGVYIEQQSFPLMHMDNATIEKKYGTDDAACMKMLRDFVRKNVFGHTLQTEFICLPGNLSRTIAQVKRSCNEYEKECTDLNHKSAFNLVVQLLQAIAYNKMRLEWRDTAEIDQHTKNKLSKAEHIFKQDRKNSLYGVRFAPQFFKQQEKNNAFVQTRLLLCIYVYHWLAPERVLNEHDLNMQQLRSVCERFFVQFKKAQAHPGEAVGTIAAQSLGAPTTQMTLNIFHQAGISGANVTLGFARLKELAAASRNPSTPVTTMFLLPEYRNEECARNIAQQLAQRSTKHLFKSVQILEADNLHQCKEMQYIQLSAQLTKALHTKEVKWCTKKRLRIVLSQSKTEKFGTSASTLRWQLLQLLGVDHVQIFATPNNFVLDADKDQGAVLHVLLSADDKDAHMKSTKPEPSQLIDPHSLDDIDDKAWIDMCENAYFKEWSTRLRNLLLGGLPGVNEAVALQESVQKYNVWDGQASKYCLEWTVQLQGGHLLNTLGLPQCDQARTISNHVMQVKDTLGIEAARHVLLEEFRKVMSFGGSYVDYRHLSLLVDTMTHSGQILPVTMNGFRKKPCGPYTRAAFEQQTNVIRDAGIYSEFEDGKDMRSAIMMGRNIPQGTGTQFDVQMNFAELSNPNSAEQNTTHHMQTLQEAKDKICAQQYSVFANPFDVPVATNYNKADQHQNNNNYIDSTSEPMLVDIVEDEDGNTIRFSKSDARNANDNTDISFHNPFETTDSLKTHHNNDAVKNDDTATFQCSFRPPSPSQFMF